MKNAVTPDGNVMGDEVGRVVVHVTGNRNGTISGKVVDAVAEECPNP